MTAKQTDDRTKTDSLQQMTATYKKIGSSDISSDATVMQGIEP